MFELFAAAKPPTSTSPNPLVLIGIAVGMLAMVALSIWLVIHRIRTRARQSDGAIVPLGFQARWYLRGRQYDGVVKGRAVHVWVLPPKRYVGSLMGVTVTTATRSHVRIGPKVGSDFVRRLLGRPSIELWPAFAEHVVSADDGARLRALTADAAVAATMLRAARGGRVVSFVDVAPGKLETHVTGTLYADLLDSPATFSAYLDDLIATAAALEAAGL